MNCHKPFVLNGSAFGCGQCTPCRINRRRIWTNRIILEASQHETNSFCTLTYSDDELPIDLSVSPREVSLFFKRLRKTLDQPIRYFAVGEYGDHSGRPHYHMALFGYPQCLRGRTDLRKSFCCAVCEPIRKAWGKGAIELACLERASAQYVAGYVVKKWTKDDDPRLEGRLPEFARMSRAPGIGLFAMHDIAHTLMETGVAEKMIDVPLSLQHGTRKLPLGRYLRRKLRLMVGRKENAPDAILAAQKEELQPLREAAKLYTPKGVPGLLDLNFREEILKKSEGRRIQIEARNRRKKRNI